MAAKKGPRVTRSPWIALLAALLACPLAQADEPAYDLVAAVSLGTGEVYAGGDPRRARLESARATVAAALKEITPDVGADLCSPVRCEREACRALETLTDVQRVDCRAFLVENAARLRKAALSARLALSAVPLGAAGDGPVAAITTLDGKSPIVFHDASVQGMADVALEALVTHELGHKIEVGGKLLADAAAYRSFSRASRLLDAAGTALALFARERLAPAQPPPPLPPGVSLEDACRLVASGPEGAAGFLAGLSADIERALPDQKTFSARLAELERALGASGARTAWLAAARGVVAAPRARAVAVGEWIQRLLLRPATADEISLLVSRFDAGDDLAAIVAAVAGDREYAAAHRVRTDADFVRTLWLELTGATPAPAIVERAVPAVRRKDRATWAFALLGREAAVSSALSAAWHGRLLNRAASPAERAVGSDWEGAIAELAAGAEYRALQRARWRACPVSAARAISTSRRAQPLKR